jgi:hypothetical protein
VLFYKISFSIGLLCFYGGTIADINNGITYNKLLTTRLEISFNKLKRFIYGQIRWDLREVEVDINWKMQVRVCPICYIDETISSYDNLNLMFGLATENELQILKFYLNNKPRGGNSFNMEFT